MAKKIQSVSKSLKELRAEVMDGTIYYLHKEVTSAEGKAALFKPNTAIGIKTLNSVEKLAGANTMLTVGLDQLDLSKELSPRPKRGVGIFKTFIDTVKAESLSPMSTVFMNKATLLITSRQYEKLFDVSAITKLEDFFLEHVQKLKGKRSSSIMGSMLTKATADAMCVLYLEEINEKKQTMRDDERTALLHSLIIGVMLKHLAKAVDVNLSASVNMEQHHPEIAVHLLNDRGTTITLNDMAPTCFAFHDIDLVKAQAFRIILDHEKIATKSRVAQLSLKGCMLSEWLFESNVNDPPLTKEILMKSGYFDAIALKYYLTLASKATEPHIKEKFAEQANVNNAMRVAIFKRYLTSKEMEYPVKEEGKLRTEFAEFFSQYPDWDQESFEYLKQIVLYENAILKNGLAVDKAAETLKKFADRIKNLIF